jgi:type I site-specific restriction endonuclease
VSAALPFGTRLLLFLYSTPNIVGSALGVVGLGLFFGGIIDDWWLAIVAGLYAVGWLATPRDRGLEIELQEAAAHASLLERIDDLMVRSRKRLPSEAYEKLKAIRATLDSLMPKLQGLSDSGSVAMEQMITVVNAVTRDLPTTVANYIRLPEAFANLHHIEQGKTARQLLLEQLDLLQVQLARIADSAFREDAEALIVNGRYLKEKFHTTDFLRSA